MSERNQGRPWQVHEDVQLTRAISEFCGDIDWKEIAKHVPGRTNKACRKRWLHSLCPTVKKTAWTKEEDRTLLSLYDAHGAKWSLIARHIAGRTDDACSKRYREALDPTLKKDDWTAEEDARLLELHVSLGGKWGQVGQQMGRSGLGCRNRWRLLERKRMSARTSAAPELLDSPLSPNFSPAELHGAPNGDHASVFNDPPTEWDTSGFFWDSQFTPSFTYASGPPQNGGPSQPAPQPTSPSSMTASPLSLNYTPFPYNGPFGVSFSRPSDFTAQPSHEPSRRDHATAPDFSMMVDEPERLLPDASLQSPVTDERQDVNTSIEGHSHDPEPPLPSIGRFDHTPTPSHLGHEPRPPSPARPSSSLHSSLSPIDSLTPSSGGDSALAIFSQESTPPIPPTASPAPAPASPPINSRSHARSTSGSPELATPTAPQSSRSSRPFLSSSLPADSDVLAYACGFSGCWASDGDPLVRFATSKELGDHIRQAHADVVDVDKPFRCALAGCKKGWKSLNGLQYHLQVSKVHFRQALAAVPPPTASATSDTPAPSKPTRKTYPCTFANCLHVYKQASGLRYHLKHGHPTEAPAQLNVVPPSLARKMDEKVQRAGAYASLPAILPP